MIYSPLVGVAKVFVAEYSAVVVAAKSSPVVATAVWDYNHWPSTIVVVVVVAVAQLASQRLLNQHSHLERFDRCC